MNDYLSKPIHISVLEEVLNRWIEKIGSAENDFEPEPSSVTEPLPLPLDARFDGGDLVDRMMGNEDLARRVVGSFIRSMPQQLMALAQALTDADPGAMRLTAHSIKGTAAVLGDQPIREMAFRLEQLGEAGDLRSAAILVPELFLTFDAAKTTLEQFCEKQA